MPGETGSRFWGLPTSGERLSAPLSFEDATTFGELLAQLGEPVVGVSSTEELDGFQVELLTEDGALVAVADERGLVRLLGTETKPATPVDQAAREGFLRILQDGSQVKRSQQKKLKGAAPRRPL